MGYVFREVKVSGMVKNFAGKNKELLSNLAGLSSINILSILIPILSIPYLSRVLGSSSYGDVLIFTSVSIFMVISIDYSCNISGVRECATSSNGLELHEIFVENQNTRLILSVVYFLFSCSYCYLSIDNMSLYHSIELSAVCIVGYYLCAPWFHQGTSTMHFFSLAMIGSKVLQLALTFALIHGAQDKMLAMRLIAYPYLICGMACHAFRRRRIGVSEERNGNYKTNFKRGFPSFIGDFAPNIYSNIPPLILGAMISPAAFASYSIAMRIVNVAGSFQTVISRSFYPLISRGVSSFKVMAMANIGLSFVAAAFVCIFRDHITHILLGAGYDDTGMFLLIGSVGIFFFSISSTLMFGYFLPKRLDSLFMKISIASSVMAAIIGYPLMAAYGAFGAVMMFVIARGIYALAYAIVFLKTNDSQHLKS